MVRNVMKHTIHKWGGDISSIHEVIGPQYTSVPTKKRLLNRKLEKKFWLFCILGYSKHFIFSWKFSFFLVGIGWDWGILGSNNLMNWWDINPPFMYCVFHHTSDHLQRQILFSPILQKSWDKIGFWKSQVWQGINFCGTPVSRQNLLTGWYLEYLEGGTS